MSNGFFKVKTPGNEPVLSYKHGSKERAALEQKLQELRSEKIEIPLIIDGKEVFTGNTKDCIVPHNKSHILATYHIASEKEINMAIDSNLRAKDKWEQMPWQHRAAIFLRAADLLSTSWRATVNAATMLAQSKTIYQAEIDSACELIDFFRYNAYFMEQIYQDQPQSTNQSWNRVEYRPLEGFVLAISPFNFTAIGGNLPSAPAMMGNVALWKPASSAVFSNYYVMKLLQEAGLPDGVINFIPSPGSLIGDIVFNNSSFAGVHFTGSTQVFNTIWKTVGQNIDKYKSYPRLVGETGGKNFVFAHNSSNIDKLVAALIQGAYEYQGQKCSAASRAYIPSSIWSEVKTKLVSEIQTIKIGDVEDKEVMMGAVIDQKSFDKIKYYIEFAKKSNQTEIIVGGGFDSTKGFFIEPTVIVVTDPYFKTMTDELFGPVLTIYVYQDEKFEKTLDLCNNSTSYGLTGAIFANDRNALTYMETALKHTAGNIYINDKPTGAVVGQQPFGGGRTSGTNDKPGSKLNLLRWTSPRTIKETFNGPDEYTRDVF